MITDADREAAERYEWLVSTMHEPKNALRHILSDHRIASTEALTAEVERLKAELADDGEMLTIAWMDGSHRSTKAHRDTIKALTARVAELEERGARAIIAYHLAICSPKGVVPMDEFYDPAIAAKVERECANARQALGAKP